MTSIRLGPPSPLALLPLGEAVVTIGRFEQVVKGRATIAEGAMMARHHHIKLLDGPGGPQIGTGTLWPVGARLVLHARFNVKDARGLAAFRLVHHLKRRAHWGWRAVAAEVEPAAAGNPERVVRGWPCEIWIDGELKPVRYRSRTVAP